jgi:nucleoside-diphosphate-sugar epimerase
MRVLVTGAAGFIGSAVLAKLAGHHEVVGLDARAPGSGPGWITGDLGEPETLALAEAARPDALIHLATVPGGAAEADPELAWRINVEATRKLIDCLARRRSGVRVVFASSIAALGRLEEPVGDATPVRPHLIYGAHKALMETWLATLSRRGDVEAISLRLPGIVARPRAASGLKSAFLSDLFHAALANEAFTCPVGRDATTWLMSVSKTAENIVHGLIAPSAEPFAATLPAVRASVGDLVAEITSQTGYDAARITYEPDQAIEADFGRFPALQAERAERLGFRSDESLASLISSALETIRKST